MLLDDVVADAQTEACPFPRLFGGEKGHAHPIEIFLRDADTLVGEFESDESFPLDDDLPGSEGHDLVLVPVRVFRVEGMTGVREEVDNDLLNLVVAGAKQGTGPVDFLVDLYMVQLDLMACQVQ